MEMNSIYSTAYLTIVAASGEDADAGLGRLQRHPAYPEHPLQIFFQGRILSFLPVMPEYDQVIQQTK